MFERLHTIILSGEKYPIKCDLLVLEKIQEEFGSINAFEEGLITWEPVLDENGEEVQQEDGTIKCRGRLPDIKVLNAALYFMVGEGEVIQAAEEGRAPRTMEKAEIIRKVDIQPQKLANQLHDEFYRCFYIKNGKATQNQERAEQTKK